LSKVLKNQTAKLERTVTTGRHKGRCSTLVVATINDAFTRASHRLVQAAQYCRKGWKVCKAAAQWNINNVGIQHGSRKCGSVANAIVAVKAIVKVTLLENVTLKNLNPIVFLKNVNPIIFSVVPSSRAGKL
jgi:hypothetical protein